MGVDVAGFCSDQRFEGIWDNFQCKRYDHALRPSDIWVEIGKIIYYSYKNEYKVPRNHYFIGSQGVEDQISMTIFTSNPNEGRFGLL